jgi:hypothetical protein
MAVGLSLVGCTPVQLAHRTLHHELNQFPRLTDGKASCRQYKRWAQEEWNRVVGESGGEWSSDYQSGFVQGFVDHVYAGGHVTPPVVPPRQYWRLPYRDEQGRQAVGQWYAGFEHGAQVAHEKGYRERAVIPSSLLGVESRGDDEWIELDAPDSFDESTPPPEPAAPEVELPTPAAPEERRGNSDSVGGLSPGGLPLPSDVLPSDGEPSARFSVVPDSASSPPRAAESPKPGGAPGSNAWTGTAAGAANAWTGNVADRPAAAAANPDTASQMPLEPVADGPPAPPWSAAADRAPGPKRNVLLASAHAPAKSSETSKVGENNEFDPFAGTQFATLSQATADRIDRGSVASPTLDEPPVSQPVTASPPLDSGSTDWVGVPVDSAGAAPKVRPLDMIASVPDKSPAMTGLAGEASPLAAQLPKTTGPKAPAAVDSPADQGDVEAADGWLVIRAESDKQWYRMD